MVRLNDASKAGVKGPIVFFGDSITAGLDAGDGEDFPTLIGNELEVETINAGVSGDTSGNALLRLDSDVISQNPAIVVVEFGGNDFLQQVPFEKTEQNFDQIFQKLSQTDAKIVIAAVRVDVLSGKYEKLQEKLAKKYNATFVPNILKGIVSDPTLMADRVHPNGEGHKRIAEKLITIIKPLI